MKILTLMFISCLINAGLINAQNQFDFSNVKATHENIVDSLQTNLIAIEWKEAADNALKIDGFTAMLSNIAGPVIAREWVHPSGAEWPVIDWSRVDKRGSFLQDQYKILETTNIVATTDQELAQICVVIEAVIASGQAFELWYEDWLLALSKSNKKNLKWLVFVTASGVADSFAKEDDEDLRALDWNKWEQAYNDSDTLGKALLLVHMTDLAIVVENYAKVSAIHTQIFEGNDDVLKAVALFAGSELLGEEVVGEWKDIQANSLNDKLKALAQEALSE